MLKTFKVLMDITPQYDLSPIYQKILSYIEYQCEGCKTEKMLEGEIDITHYWNDSLGGNIYFCDKCVKPCKTCGIKCGEWFFVDTYGTTCDNCNNWFCEEHLHTRYYYKCQEFKELCRKCYKCENLKMVVVDGKRTWVKCSLAERDFLLNSSSSDEEQGHQDSSYNREGRILTSSDEEPDIDELYEPNI